MPGYFFKYRYGYVNLQNSRLYFTHTGNWAEVRRLDQIEELEPGSSVWRRSRMALFVFVVAIAVLSFSIAKASSTGVWVGTLLGALVFIFKLFQTMSPEMGKTFWLSRKRIKDVLEESGGVRIVYENLDGQADTVLVGGVGEADRAILLKWIKAEPGRTFQKPAQS